MAGSQKGSQRGSQKGWRIHRGQPNQQPRRRRRSAVLFCNVTRSVGVASPSETSAGPSAEITRAVLPCEIRIVDEEKREIEVCATSEAVDSYGTVFGYDASKDAFSRWAGNVREMHERKAVGRKVALRYDDAAKRVYTRLRISRGAEDTWEKVKDGTLAGASIGASNVEWRQQRLSDGQDVPVATRYDLVELSLVDLPSNPDALGVTFVRDGVPDDALLDDLEAAGIAEDARAQTPAGESSDAPAALAAPLAPSPTNTIDERDGSLSTEDPAALIAAAALSRGQSELSQAAATAAGSGSSFRTLASPELTAKQRRLAALGAPGYVERPAESNAERASAADEAPGAMYDADGDHDAGAGEMEHADSAHAHMAHDHAHSGNYSATDIHQHAGAHMHMDGTSHTHDHQHDHEHHDHPGDAGHSHMHAHTHDHSHYYRVADGFPLDSRLVSGEQARTHEYVSAEAFRISGGTEGQPLMAEQYRAAASHDERALGPYSRHPAGPADAGTPDEAPAAPSADMQQTPEGNAGAPSLDHYNLEDELRRTGQCPLCHGQVRALDRDGNPVADADANGCEPGDMPTTGTSDVSMPADGWNGRAVVSEITRALQPQYAALAGTLNDLAQRLQRIEQTPQNGGPVLRAADRGSAFAPGGYSAAGKPGAHEQYAALESLAGRLNDPQAQVAVAAEMIRLQQEAAGMTPAMQVMPRAGTGWKSAGQ